MTVLITYILFVGGAATLLQVNSYQHKIFLPPQNRLTPLNFTACLQITAVRGRGSYLGWRKVMFICPIRACSGLAE